MPGEPRGKIARYAWGSDYHDVLKELAHSLVARRNGIEVDSIVLWLLGGVAQLRGEPRTPGADFRIAIVGPLTSVTSAPRRKAARAMA